MRRYSNPRCLRYHRTETADEQAESQQRSLTRDEAGQYSRLFRKRVFGRYERRQAIEIPVEESFLNSITERPATIELVEKTAQTDDGKQYEIRMRWTESTDDHGE